MGKTKTVDPVVESKTVTAPTTAYVPGNGQFLYKAPHGWQMESCRERFHSASFQTPIPTKGDIVSLFDEFFMGVPPNGGGCVINFMKIVDAASRSDEPVEVSLTNVPGLIHVKMPPWWANNPIRRNVLTAFLRAGTHYKEETGECFERSLNAISYLKDTRPAVDLFLSGGSRVKNKKGEGFTGWYNCFRNNENPERILVKIKRKRPEKPQAEKPDSKEAGVA